MKEELKQNQENWFNHNVLAWIECDICADGIFCKKSEPKPENQNVKIIGIANIVQRTELGMIE